MTATNDAVLMTEPPPLSSRWGMPCLQHRKTDLRLTSCTRCHASSDVSSTETSSGGEMPALLNSTSMRPVLATRALVDAAHRSSSVTSTSSERSTSGDGLRSTPTTDAPSARNSAAVSAPMPLAVP
jgi:hypothetical protein